MNSGTGRGQTQFSPVQVGQPLQGWICGIDEPSLSAQTGGAHHRPSGSLVGPTDEGRTGGEQPGTQFTRRPAFSPRQRSAQQALQVPFLPFSMVVFSFCLLPCFLPLKLPSSSWLPMSGWTHNGMYVLARGELLCLVPLSSALRGSLTHPSISLLLRSDVDKAVPVPAESPAEFSALGQTASLSHIPFWNFLSKSLKWKVPSWGALPVSSSFLVSGHQFTFSDKKINNITTKMNNMLSLNELLPCAKLCRHITLIRSHTLLFCFCFPMLISFFIIFVEIQLDVQLLFIFLSTPCGLQDLSSPIRGWTLGP